MSLLQIAGGEDHDQGSECFDVLALHGARPDLECQSAAPGRAHALSTIRLAPTPKNTINNNDRRNDLPLRIGLPCAVRRHRAAFVVPPGECRSLVICSVLYVSPHAIPRIARILCKKVPRATRHRLRRTSSTEWRGIFMHHRLHGAAPQPDVCVDGSSGCCDGLTPSPCAVHVWTAGR